jgi:hypothetical protein
MSSYDKPNRGYPLFLAVNSLGAHERNSQLYRLEFKHFKIEILSFGIVSRFRY